MRSEVSEKKRIPSKKKDLLLEIADLREQLSEARECMREPQNGSGDGTIMEKEQNRIQQGGRNPEPANGESLSIGEDGAKPTGRAGLIKLYRQVLSYCKEGITIQDVRGRILEQNAAHRNLLGYSDDELVGKTLGHYLEGGRSEFGKITKALSQSGKYCGELRCRTKSGQGIDAEIAAFPIRDEAGGITGFATLVHDLTEMRRTEAALRESEERFAAFMNNSSVVALMRNLEGQYVYVNRAFEELVGKAASEILGKTAYEIWPPEIAKMLIAADRQVLATGRSVELQEKTILPGGKPKEWVSIKFPFRDGRNREYVGGVAIDITKQKSLEEQLLQSQKMEAVGRLAGGIAHDFNNLLTIIIGYSEILLGSSKIDADERSKVQELKKAGERAARLTRQLLAFSRKQVMAPKVMDLNILVENLRKMIERLIGEDIELVTIPFAPLGSVKADPGQVEQIIMNLVVNARDAMPDGGRLTIETANVKFDEKYARSHLPSLPGEYVMIAVSDTGTGMDPEIQKHIFEPFFTTKETGKGTGLGLATAYGIVKQSGGFIWVYSEQNVGTTFKVYFPRIQEQKELPLETRQEPEKLEGTETVLVAEDEVALRTLIRETLDRHGYTVLEAGDGKEALKISGRYENPIHLLIADVVMPHMSGRELARQVTALRPEAEVLYISGYTDEAIIHHGFIDPNMAFLQKPFSPHALAKKVRVILNQRPASKS